MRNSFAIEPAQEQPNMKPAQRSGMLYTIPPQNCFSFQMHDRKGNLVGKCYVQSANVFNVIVRTEDLEEDEVGKNVNATFVISDANMLRMTYEIAPEQEAKGNMLYVANGMNEFIFEYDGENGVREQEVVFSWNFASLVVAMMAQTDINEYCFASNVQAFDFEVAFPQEAAELSGNTAAEDGLFAIDDHVGETVYIDTDDAFRIEAESPDGKRHGIVIFTCDVPFRVVFNDKEVKEEELTILLDSINDLSVFHIQIIGDSQLYYDNNYNQIWAKDENGVCSEYLFGWEIVAPVDYTDVDEELPSMNDAEEFTCNEDCENCEYKNDCEYRNFINKEDDEQT